MSTKKTRRDFLRAGIGTGAAAFAGPYLFPARAWGANERGAAEVWKYQNPNLQVPMRDPHILPDQGRYYVVGTSAPFWPADPRPNPGVKLYSSDNLSDWEYEGLLIDASQLAEDVWYKDRFWAPELHRIGGRYYLTFNSRNQSREHKHHHACGVAVAGEVTGPYTVLTHKKPLTPWKSTTNDLTLYEDDDGKVYALFNGRKGRIHRIWTAEVDMENMRLVEDPVELIRHDPGTWEDKGIEGAYVVKKEGVYYLFYSSWTHGYAVGYATSSNIRGPWKRSEANPLFGARKDGRGIRYGKIIDDPDFPYSAVGHNSVFRGPDGRYWTSCHAYLTGWKQGVMGGKEKVAMVIDPIAFKDGRILFDGPTYTPQYIHAALD